MSLPQTERHEDDKEQTQEQQNRFPLAFTSTPSILLFVSLHFFSGKWHFPAFSATVHDGVAVEIMQSLIFFFLSGLVPDSSKFWAERLFSAREVNGENSEREIHALRDLNTWALD